MNVADMATSPATRAGLRKSLAARTAVSQDTKRAVANLKTIQELAFYRGETNNIIHDVQLHADERHVQD